MLRNYFINMILKWNDENAKCKQNNMNNEMLSSYKGQQLRIFTEKNFYIWRGLVSSYFIL